MGKLSVTDDDDVRAIRDHIRGARACTEAALRYVMLSEVREELLAAQARLALALDYIGK